MKAGIDKIELWTDEFSVNDGSLLDIKPEIIKASDNEVKKEPTLMFRDKKGKEF